MRSAETSGVGANGFQADQETATAASAVRSGHRIGFLPVSPITLAVAITSVLAATLFIAYDTVSTLMETDGALVAISSELAELEQPRPALLDRGLPNLLAPTGSAGLVATPVGLDITQPMASVLPDVGAAVGDTSAADNLWIGIAQRGGIAFGLAALLVLIAARSRLAGMSDVWQRQNYRTVAAAIPMGVACWTRTGELVVCNDSFRQRLNLTLPHATYRQTLQGLINGGYVSLINEDDNNRLLELHGEDGSCLLIDERPLADGGFMTLVSDITERKQIDSMLQTVQSEQRLLARRYHEEKLKAEAANHAKTNFLAHLSHDIRTPLNHIIGFAEMMRHQTYGPLGDPRYADYVQSIKQSGEHLLASFATILDLAEFESGAKVLRSEPVAVDDLLDSVLERFHGQAKRAGIAFVRCAPCQAVVLGDRMGLARMVGNIMDNALRFTPRGGSVTLAAFAARDGVVIEITDTGLGMSEDRLASLSQPFARGDATFTREGVGQGLGISIARAIAEQSGGKLAIDSSPALGTTVAISLPLDSMINLQAAE
ncbi:PAS domain-containing sensor histidine kinase [Devosia sp. FKR38]|uniref:sensor histidine kinase n=1 Tax=Devosia sp. FKR38 TaxID=2562312 RepID=UPI0010BFA60E|nr:PAS domain-containing sensor histidine kinase [Devosia sp. FKR38]